MLPQAVGEIVQLLTVLNNPAQAEQHAQAQQVLLWLFVVGSVVVVVDSPAADIPVVVVVVVVVGLPRCFCGEGCTDSCCWSRWVSLAVVVRLPLKAIRRKVDCYYLMSACVSRRGLLVSCGAANGLCPPIYVCTSPSVHVH